VPALIATRTAMRYWLMKSEPDEFSIDDLARRKREPWSGVRNYQARNFMRDRMAPGDPVLFYHSSCATPGVYGLARVASAAYPDPSQFDRRSDYYDAASRRDEPRWLLVDVAYERTLRAPITLEALKREPKLAGMLILERGNRLSITPVERRHYEHILSLEPAA
jgi:predicted RNA-binding protein with PUA-like domain